MFRSIPFILMVQMGLFGAICFTAYQNNDWTLTPAAAVWTVSYLCLILFLDMCRSDENWLQQTYSLLFIVTCCLAGGSFIGATKQLPIRLATCSTDVAPTLLSKQSKTSFSIFLPNKESKSCRRSKKRLRNWMKL